MYTLVQDGRSPEERAAFDAEMEQAPGDAEQAARRARMAYARDQGAMA